MFEGTHGVKGLSFVWPSLSLHNPLCTFAPLSIPSISRSFNSTTVFSFSPAVSDFHCSPFCPIHSPRLPPLHPPRPSIPKAKSSAQRFLVNADLTNQTGPSFKKLIFAVPLLPPFFHLSVCQRTFVTSPLISHSRHVSPFISRPRPSRYRVRLEYANGFKHNYLRHLQRRGKQGCSVYQIFSVSSDHVITHPAFIIFILFFLLSTSPLKSDIAMNLHFFFFLPYWAELVRSFWEKRFKKKKKKAGWVV